MKDSPKHTRRGFTLIELSIAMMLGMATAGMVLTLFNQQLTFLNLFRNQNFLTEEAPIINNYVARLIGKADRFRLHANRNDAVTGVRPLSGTDLLNPARVLVLNFRQPDGTIRAAILEYADRGAGPALNYYLVPANGVTPNGVLWEPQWVITKAPSKVTFQMTQGVLQVVLTGPNQEQVIYSGTTQ